MITSSAQTCFALHGLAAVRSGLGKLDEAVEAYQRGAKLKAVCERKLKEAQAKIEKIQLDSQGEPQTAPFEEN